MPRASAYITADLSTELRLVTLSDAVAMYGLIESNRSYLREWLPWLDFTQSVEDEQAFINSALVQYQNNQSCTYAVWHQGQIVGAIGYNEIDWTNRKADIGYWLAAQYQGKGITTQACRALIQHAFKGLSLNKIEILCATMNTRSCAIPQRLGFTQEGILRQAEWLYDHFVDLKLYGLLVDEWMRPRQWSGDR